LLHFLWQGRDWRPVCSGGSGLPQRAGALPLAVGALVLMMVSPGHHITWLSWQSESDRADWGGRSFDVGGSPPKTRPRCQAPAAPVAASRTEQPMAMLWLVEACSWASLIEP